MTLFSSEIARVRRRLLHWLITAVVITVYCNLQGFITNPRAPELLRMPNPDVGNRNGTAVVMTTRGGNQFKRTLPQWLNLMGPYDQFYLIDTLDDPNLFLPHEVEEDRRIHVYRLRISHFSWWAVFETVLRKTTHATIYFIDSDVLPPPDFHVEKWRTDRWYFPKCDMHAVRSWMSLGYAVCDYSLDHEEDGTLSVVSRCGETGSNGQLPALRSQSRIARGPQWHHVAFTVDDTGAKPTATLYINGTQEHVVDNFEAPDLFFNMLHVGTRGQSQRHNRHIAGGVHQVRVYKKALTPEEIKEDMKPVYTKLAETSVIDMHLASKHHAHRATVRHDAKGKYLYFNGVDEDVTVGRDQMKSVKIGLGQFSMTGWIKNEGPAPSDQAHFSMNMIVSREDLRRLVDSAPRDILDQRGMERGMENLVAWFLCLRPALHVTHIDPLNATSHAPPPDMLPYLRAFLRINADGNAPSGPLLSLSRFCLSSPFLLCNDFWMSILRIPGVYHLADGLLQFLPMWVPFLVIYNFGMGAFVATLATLAVYDYLASWIGAPIEVLLRRTYRRNYGGQVERGEGHSGRTD